MNLAANDTLIAETRYVPSRDIKDVAKDVRRDIAAAVKSGALPAGLRASVTISRYSMGQSLKVEIVAMPAGYVVLSVARVRADVLTPHAFTQLNMRTPDADRCLATIERLMSAYNRDRSDIQADHFDVTFYGHARFSHEIEMAQRAEMTAAIRAAYGLTG